MYNIFEKFKKVSYKNGKFLSDKSYAYDTIYFVSKFIIKFQKNSLFDLELNRENFNKYIIDIFNRNKDSSGTSNYYLEVLNLFEYAGIIEEIEYKKYKILDHETFDFINDRMENAYIFSYILTYNTFKNDNLLYLYSEMCNSETTNQKEIIILKLNSKISEINVSIKTPGTVWEKLNTKYAVTVLNFANEQKFISRELKIQNKIADIESISVNVKGTKTFNNLPKNNFYLKTFDANYVKEFLKDYLFIKISNQQLQQSISLAEDEILEITNLKLDLIELQNDVQIIPEEFSGEQYVENVVRTRNASAQRRFRNNLLKYSPHKCAICGLPLSELLIASHIKPYSKCEEIYDAVNYENGLLMCPMHDALFESAKYITINSDNGNIIIGEQYLPFKDLFGLNDMNKISNIYLTNERKHYLDWHNNKFNEINNCKTK